MSEGFGQQAGGKKCQQDEHCRHRPVQKQVECRFSIERTKMSSMWQIQ